MIRQIFSFLSRRKSPAPLKDAHEAVATASCAEVVQPVDYREKIKAATVLYRQKIELLRQKEKEQSDLGERLHTAQCQLNEAEELPSKCNKKKFQSSIDRRFDPDMWCPDDSAEQQKKHLAAITSRTTAAQESLALCLRQITALENKIGKVSTRLGTLARRPAVATAVTPQSAEPAPMESDNQGFALAATCTTVPIPKTLNDLQQWAEQYLADKIVILPRAIKETISSGYTDTKTLYQAVLLLANEYRNQIVIGDDDSRKAFTQRMQALYCTVGKVHSSTSGGIKVDAYSFQHEGKTLFCNTHLRKGNSREPRYCLRIYFTYDEATKRIVVGHMPTHLKNALS